MKPWPRRSEMDMWNLRLGRISREPAASTPQDLNAGGSVDGVVHFLDSSDSDSDSTLSSSSSSSSSWHSSEEDAEQRKAKVTFLEQLGLRTTSSLTADKDVPGRKPSPDRKSLPAVKLQPRRQNKGAATGKPRA